MHSKFDQDVARRIGDVVRTLRLLVKETQAQLGARCVPVITLTRVCKLERGVAKIRPRELNALRAALPALAALLRPQGPRVLGKPAGPHAPRATSEPR
jgi:hypothetical protein